MRCNVGDARAAWSVHLNHEARHDDKALLCTIVHTHILFLPATELKPRGFACMLHGGNNDTAVGIAMAAQGGLKRNFVEHLTSAYIY